MNLIHDEETLKAYYKDEALARKYIEERFVKPLGRVQHRIQVETINDVIRSYRIDDIAEVACGPARLTADVSGFKRGIAIDTSDQMLEIARQRVRNPDKWRFVNADAFNLKLNSRSQLIYSFRFIRHFKTADRMRLYKTFHGLLDNHGILIFDALHYEKIAFIRNIESKGQEKIYDKIYPNKKALEEEMTIAGYEILGLKGTIHHFYAQAAISRISYNLRMEKLGMRIIRFMEQVPLGCPLEWIVICRKK